MAEPPTAYGLVFGFEDQSHSYALGFEAGMIWSLMEVGEPEIDRITRVENSATLIRMAAAGGYEIDVTGTETIGWARTLFVKKPQPRAALRLVEQAPSDA